MQDDDGGRLGGEERRKKGRKEKGEKEKGEGRRQKAGGAGHGSDINFLLRENIKKTSCSLLNFFASILFPLSAIIYNQGDTKAQSISFNLLT